MKKERKKTRGVDKAPVIPAFWMQKLEDHKFKASLSYVRYQLKEREMKEGGEKRESNRFRTVSLIAGQLVPWRHMVLGWPGCL